MSRLITTAELQRLTLAELHALRRAVEDELLRSNPDTATRRNALASLENIERAIGIHNRYRARPSRPHRGPSPS